MVGEADSKRSQSERRVGGQRHFDFNPVMHQERDAPLPP
jgi:hypothetical protein